MTSTEFIKQRLPYSNIDIKDLSHAFVYDGGAELTELLHGQSILILTGKLEDGTTAKINIEIKYDPDADFEYFTYSSSTHDGTMLFIKECIDRCLCKVVGGETYNKQKQAPHDGCTIYYTIGDFVVVNEYGEQFAPKEKPWMRQRTTVFCQLDMK